MKAEIDVYHEEAGENQWGLKLTTNSDVSNRTINLIDYWSDSKNEYENESIRFAVSVDNIDNLITALRAIKLVVEENCK